MRSRFALITLTGLLAVALSASAHSTASRRPHVSATTKVVALTFDDGPYGTSTQQVLQILREKKVHATFFLIGRNVARYPDEARQIVAEGNVVGNHTYTHANLGTVSTGAALADVAAAEQEIASTTGVRTLLFRPPYGVLPKPARTMLVAQGYRIVMWNDDPKDWNAASSSKAQIVARVLAQEKPRLVIVLHDGRDTQANYPRQNLIDALPALIDELKRQGYTFVTIDKLR